MLAAHDEVTSDPGKPTTKMGKLANRGRHAAHTASLDHQLSETARPPGSDDPLLYGGRKTRALAKTRCRSLQGAGTTTAWYRARPTDSLRVLTASEFLDMVQRQRVLGIEDYVAATCSCCDVVDVDTRHAPVCPRAGAQVNQHQPLLHVITRTRTQAAWDPSLSRKPGALHGRSESQDGHSQQKRSSSRRSPPAPSSLLLATPRLEFNCDTLLEMTTCVVTETICKMRCVQIPLLAT